MAESETACPHDGAATQPIERPTLPQSLAAKFTDVQPFCAGQTGVSFLATASSNGSHGLLKVVSLSTLDNSERVRLKRELRKQARLTHDALPQILDGGESGSDLWLFREFVEGESLAQRIRRRGALEVGEALAIAAQVASGLDELQRNGLLHRDVKPGHVILQAPEDGASGAASSSIPAVRLVDAGIASRLSTGSIFDLLGTPAYISPEQVAGKLVSFRSDIYALGCVLFEMLSGKPPFPTDDVRALLEAHKSTPAPALEVQVPPAAGALLRSMLAKEPRERPFSALQVRRTLEPLLPEGSPLPAPGTRAPTGTPLPKSPVPRPLPPLPNARGGGAGNTDEIEFEELQSASMPPPRDTMRISDDEVDAMQVNLSVPPSPRPVSLSDSELRDLESVARPPEAASMLMEPSAVRSPADPPSLPGSPGTVILNERELRELQVGTSLPVSPATVMLSDRELREMEVGHSGAAASPATVMLSDRELREMEVGHSGAAASPATVMLSDRELREMEVRHPATGQHEVPAGLAPGLALERGAARPSSASPPAARSADPASLPNGDRSAGQDAQRDSAMLRAPSAPPPADSSSVAATAPRESTPPPSDSAFTGEAAAFDAAAAPRPSAPAGRRASAAPEASAGASRASRISSPNTASDAQPRSDVLESGTEDTGAEAQVDARSAPAPAVPSQPERAGQPSAPEAASAEPARAATHGVAGAEDDVKPAPVGSPDARASRGPRPASAEAPAIGEASSAAAAAPGEPAAIGAASGSTPSKQPRRGNTVGDTALQDVVPTQIYRPRADSSAPVTRQAPRASERAAQPQHSAWPRGRTRAWIAAAAGSALLVTLLALFVRRSGPGASSSLAKIDAEQKPSVVVVAPTPPATDVPPEPTTAPEAPAPEASAAEVPGGDAPYVPELPPEDEGAGAAPEASEAAAKSDREPSASQRQRAAAAEHKSEGRAHYQAGRYRQAATAYQKAVTANPTDAGAFAGLAASRLASGDVNGAISGYSRAVRLSPNSSGFHAALGRAYLQKGDRRAARREYDRALQLDRNNLAARTALSQLK